MGCDLERPHGESGVLCVCAPRGRARLGGTANLLM